MSTQPTLDFVLINVSDIEASSRYYTEILGFTVYAEQSGPNFCYLKGAPGSAELGLNLADKEHPAGQIEFYFRAHDAESLRAELVAKNVAASPIQHPPFGTIFSLPAPDNETIIMWERNK